MVDVFISYSRKDTEFVRQLHHSLEKQGRDIWVDWQNIPLSANWWHEICEGIEAADTFIFIISPDSVASPVCNFEIAHALKYNKRILPLVLQQVDESQAFAALIAHKLDETAIDILGQRDLMATARESWKALARHNWLFFNDNNSYDNNFSKLLIAIDTNLDYVKAHTRLLLRSQEWLNTNKETSRLLFGAALDEAEQWQVESANLDPRPTEQQLEYIFRSRQRQRAQGRGQRLVLGALSIVIFVFAIGATVFGYVASKARDAEAVARDAEAAARADAVENAQGARARELASGSLVFADDFPDKAILLALQSLAVRDTFEGRNALLTSMLSQWRIQSYLNGHESFVRKLSLSSNGSFLASGDADGMVIVWDNSGNNVLQRLQKHSAPISALAFSPDSSYLVSADADGNLYFWDTQSWSLLDAELHIQTSDLRAIAFSPDGKWLAASTTEGIIHLWNTDDFSKEAKILEGHNGTTIYALAFSPDSSLLVSGGEDGALYYWDMDTFEPDVVTAHNGWILTIAFSPDGTLLASSGLDRVVRVWTVTDHQLLWEKAGHSERVTNLTFNESGSLLISGDLKANIVLWNAQTGAGSLINNISQVAVRDFATMGNTLYVAGDSNQIYKLSIVPTPRFGETIAQVPHELWAVQISASGRQIAFAGGSSLSTEASQFGISLWDAESKTITNLPLIHTAQITDILYSGNQMISFGLDKRVIIWNNNESQKQFFASDAIDSAAIHDNILALGLNNGDIELWDLSSGDDKPFKTLREHTERVNALAFDSSGQFLASASRDSRAILWDVESATPKLQLTKHNDSVESIAISPDGKIIASGGRDTNIILWDASTGEQLGPPFTEHEDWVTDLAFNADGSLLASASNDRSIMLWDVQTQRLLGKPFFGHINFVNKLAFNPDGTQMASVGSDGTVILWDTSLSAWESRACSIANRSLNESEIRDYFGGVFQPASVCNS